MLHCALAAATLAAWYAASASGSGSTAQSQSESRDLPAFVLGTVSTPPGTAVSVPLFYKPGSIRSIRTVRLELEFARDKMQFLSARNAAGAGPEHFTVTAMARESSSENGEVRLGRVVLDVAPVDPDSVAPLPEGLLGWLEFRVPSDSEGESIRLVPIGVSAEDESRHPVKTTAEEGMLIVVSTEIPACFFYMH